MREDTERGYTLMEIVVAAVPLSLVALSLFTAFGFTVSFSRRGEAGIEATGQGRLALHHLANELREASAAPGAIVTWSRGDGSEGDGIGFLSARADAPGRPFATEAFGTPRWQHAVYYIHDPARAEVRRIVGDPTALTWPPAEASGRIIARQVQRFHVARQRDAVTITLTVKQPFGETRLETAVRPRN